MIYDWNCVLEVYKGLNNIIDSNELLARSYKLMSKGVPKYERLTARLSPCILTKLISNTLLLAVDAVEAAKDASKPCQNNIMALGLLCCSSDRLNESVGQLFNGWH